MKSSTHKGLGPYFFQIKENEKEKNISKENACQNINKNLPDTSDQLAIMLMTKNDQTDFFKKTTLDCLNRFLKVFSAKKDMLYQDEAAYFQGLQNISNFIGEISTLINPTTDDVDLDELYEFFKALGLGYFDHLTNILEEQTDETITVIKKQKIVDFIKVINSTCLPGLPGKIQDLIFDMNVNFSFESYIANSKYSMLKSIIQETINESKLLEEEDDESLNTHYVHCFLLQLAEKFSLSIPADEFTKFCEEDVVQELQPLVLKNIKNASAEMLIKTISDTICINGFFDNTISPNSQQYEQFRKELVLLGIINKDDSINSIMEQLMNEDFDKANEEAKFKFYQLILTALQKKKIILDNKMLEVKIDQISLTLLVQPDFSFDFATLNDGKQIYSFIPYLASASNEVFSQILQTVIQKFPHETGDVLVSLYHHLILKEKLNNSNTMSKIDLINKVLPFLFEIESADKFLAILSQDSKIHLYQTILNNVSKKTYPIEYFEKLISGFKDVSEVNLFLNVLFQKEHQVLVETYFDMIVKNLNKTLVSSDESQTNQTNAALATTSENIKHIENEVNDQKEEKDDEEGVNEQKEEEEEEDEEEVNEQKEEEETEEDEEEEEEEEEVEEDNEEKEKKDQIELPFGNLIKISDEDEEEIDIDSTMKKVGVKTISSFNDLLYFSMRHLIMNHSNDIALPYILKHIPQNIEFQFNKNNIPMLLLAFYFLKPKEFYLFLNHFTLCHQEKICSILTFHVITNGLDQLNCRKFSLAKILADVKSSTLKEFNVTKVKANQSDNKEEITEEFNSNDCHTSMEVDQKVDKDNVELSNAKPEETPTTIDNAIKFYLLFERSSFTFMSKMLPQVDDDKLVSVTDSIFPLHCEAPISINLIISALDYLKKIGNPEILMDITSNANGAAIVLLLEYDFSEFEFDVVSAIFVNANFHIISELYKELFNQNKLDAFTNWFNKKSSSNIFLTCINTIYSSMGEQSGPELIKSFDFLANYFKIPLPVNDKITDNEYKILFEQLDSNIAILNKDLIITWFKQNSDLICSHPLYHSLFIKEMPSQDRNSPDIDTLCLELLGENTKVNPNHSINEQSTRPTIGMEDVSGYPYEENEISQPPENQDYEDENVTFEMDPISLFFVPKKRSINEIGNEESDEEIEAKKRKLNE